MKTDLELRNLYAVRHRNLSTKRDTVDVSHDLILQLITEVLEHRGRDRDRLALNGLAAQTAKTLASVNVQKLDAAIERLENVRDKTTIGLSIRETFYLECMRQLMSLVPEHEPSLQTDVNLAIPDPFGQLRWLINNHFRVSLVSRGDKVDRCRLVVENQQGTAQAISTDMNLEDVITPVFIQLSRGHHLQGGK